MDIDSSIFGDLQNIDRQDLAECDHHQKVGRKFFQSGDKRGVADLGRLCDGIPNLPGGLFHRWGRKNASPSFGAVGLGHDQYYIDIGRVQRQ
jgi:hypothetical protein